MPELDLADYLNIRDAAKQYNLHPETIRNMLRRGYFEGLKIARDWLVSKKSIESYLEITAGMGTFSPERKAFKEAHGSYEAKKTT